MTVVRDFALAFGVTGNRRNNGRGGLEGTSPNEVTAELRSFGATTRQESAASRFSTFKLMGSISTRR